MTKKNDVDPRADAMGESTDSRTEPYAPAGATNATDYISALPLDWRSIDLTLVAAAPDLLAALKALAKDYEAILGDGLTESNQPPLLRVARAAIKKAEVGQ